jgi:hypothetical protein
LDGVVIGATKFVNNGPDEERFNFVLLAEGYQQSELGKFASDAQAFVDYFVKTPPFSTNRTCFNFWRIDVASTQSGADDPAGCSDGTTGSGTMVNTYFDATFCSWGLRRLLTVDDSLALTVLGAQVPNWDAALVIVNSTSYGGSGGTVGVTSLAGTWQQIAIHEFGHSGFGLADEYAYWAGCSADPAGTRDYHPSSEPVSANVTIQATNNLVKWRDLFYLGIAIPTTVNANCAQCDSQPDPFPGQARVGLYEGADYYHCGAYRPAFRCMMRDYAPFCPVCAARIAQVLQPYQPGNSPPLVFNPSFHANAFTLSVPTSIGKTYQLEFKNSLADLTWTPLPQTSGTGQMLVLTDAAATNAHRFYHVRQWYIVERLTNAIRSRSVIESAARMIQFGGWTAPWRVFDPGSEEVMDAWVSPLSARCRRVLGCVATSG